MPALMRRDGAPHDGPKASSSRWRPGSRNATGCRPTSCRH